MDYKTCYKCGKILPYKDKCQCTLEEDKQRQREYMKEYSENNAEITDPIKSGRYKEFRKYIIHRDKGYCQRCKNLLGMLTTENLEVHHIKPRIHYPELIFDDKNVITVCRQCNMALGTSGELDFEPDKATEEDRDFKFF